MLPLAQNFSSTDADDAPVLSADGVAEPVLSDAGHLRPLPPYAVRLEFFSGPMDLLLHLVHQQEVSVSEVSMKEVAEQYLKIISHTTFLDLEKASEYLVIAATLLAMKSRMLLPTESSAMTEDEAALFGADQGEDFLEELRARLQAYEITKKRAEALTELPQLGVDTFARNDKKALLPTPEMLQEPEDGSSLGDMFVALLKRIGDAGRSYAVRMEPVSVVSFMMRIVGVFEQRPAAERGMTESALKEPSQSFRGLLAMFGRQRKSQTGPIPSSRGMVIGTFIAILELMKRGLLTGTQHDDGDVVLEQRFTGYADDNSPSSVASSTAPPSIHAFTSEFDEPAPQAGESRDNEAETLEPQYKNDWVNSETGQTDYEGHTSRPRKRQRRVKPHVERPDNLLISEAPLDKVREVLLEAGVGEAPSEAFADDGLKEVMSGR